MKKKVLFMLTLVLMSIALIGAISASAATEGIFTYSVMSGGASITRCNNTASGEIVIPDTLGGYPVTSIGNRAFYQCREITSVEIPAGVTDIGTEAFYNCDSLRSITIPDSMRSIRRNAFENCFAIETVHYLGTEHSWHSIMIDSGNEMFSDAEIRYEPRIFTYSVINDAVIITCCTDSENLEIVIPDKIDGYPVTAIGSNAFDECERMMKITIPESVATIEANAFYMCRDLQIVYFSATDKEWELIDIASGNDYLINAERHYSSEVYTYIISDGKVTITNCFDDESSELVIPETIYGHPVTKIEESAFINCYNLETVTIPKTVTDVSGGVFYGCRSLKNIQVDEENPTFSSFNGDIYNKDKTTFVRYAPGKTDTDVVILDCVENIESYAFYFCNKIKNLTIGNNVKSIGDYAFYWNTGLANAKIGNNVTQIGNYAFYCCNFSSIDIPDSVKTIGDNAFSSCSKLESFTLGNSVVELGEYFLASCRNVKSIDIPDSVKIIGNYAFRQCEALESITIGNGVTTIGKYAFIYCEALSRVTIGNSVTTIGEHAFFDCEKIVNITLPKSVKVIGNAAFSWCTGLKSIVIPEKVTTIDEDSFYGCTSLTTVTIPHSVTSIGTRAFYNCNNIKTVYYGAQAEQWEKISVGSDNEYLTGANIIFSEKLYVFVDENGYADIKTAVDMANEGSVIEVAIPYDANNAEVTLPEKSVLDVTAERNLKNAFVTATGGATVKMGETDIIGESLRFGSDGKLNVSANCNAKLKSGAKQSFLWTVNSSELSPMIKFVITSDDEFNGKAYEYNYGKGLEAVEGDTTFALTFDKVPENIEIEIED